MQILINMPENTYRRIQALVRNDYFEHDICGNSMRRIAEGKVLPKEYGRLIDADKLYGDFIDGTEGYDCQTWNRIEIGDIIENVPTIIEADRSEEE